MAGDGWLDADAPTRVELSVNGKAVACEVPPRRTLADALRDAGLTGTRLGCEHGVCGTCTILLDGAPVRACLMLAVQAVGHELQTVEGLAGEDGAQHPLQKAFHERNALQCGFCTPGFLMVGAGLLAESPNASREQVREAVSGNLCRCTGGPPIVEAIIDAQAELNAR
jgi:carbon-monoxide dehydrogenase small subunit